MGSILGAPVFSQTDMCAPKHPWFVAVQERTAKVLETIGDSAMYRGVGVLKPYINLLPDSTRPAIVVAVVHMVQWLRYVLA